MNLPTGRSLRGLVPPSGLPYELFNSAVLIIALSWFWYVGSAPSAVTDAALSDTLALLLAPRTWGVGMMTVGVGAAVCSYRSHRRVMHGYVLLAGASGAWSIALLVGSIFSVADHDLLYKALGSAVLFGYVTRNLVASVLAKNPPGARP